MLSIEDLEKLKKFKESKYVILRNKHKICETCLKKISNDSTHIEIKKNFFDELGKHSKQIAVYHIECKINIYKILNK